MSKEEVELGGIAGMTAVMAAILREYDDTARARIEAFARKNAASVPIELLAPHVDAAETRDTAQKVVSQIFNVAAD